MSYESSGMARGLSWLGPGSLGGDVRTLGWRGESVAALTAYCSQPKGHGTEGGESGVEMPVTKDKDETWMMCSLESWRKLCFLLSRAS